MRLSFRLQAGHFFILPMEGLMRSPIVVSFMSLTVAVALVAAEKLNYFQSAAEPPDGNRKVVCFRLSTRITDRRCPFSGEHSARPVQRRIVPSE